MVASIVLGAAAAIGASQIGVGVWAALAIGAGVAGLDLLTRPKLPDLPEHIQRATTVNLPSVASHTVVGTYPTGGMLVYIAGDGEALHLAYVLSGARGVGLLDEINAIKVGPTWATLYKRTTSGTEPLTPHSAGTFYTHVEVYPYLTGAASAGAELVEATKDLKTPWTASHKLSGISWCYVRLMQDCNPDEIYVHPNLVLGYNGWRRVRDHNPSPNIRSQSDDIGLTAEQVRSERFRGRPELSFLCTGTVSDNPVEQIVWYNVNKRNVPASSFNDTAGAVAFSKSSLSIRLVAG